MENSLLELLEREKWKVNTLNNAKSLVERYREEENNFPLIAPYLAESRSKYEAKLNAATKELEDVRREIRAYFKDVLNL